MYPLMLRVLLLTLTLIAPFAQGAQAVLQRPITLPTSQGTLFGTLELPKTDAQMPVALLIAGSGPTDRNGNNPGGGHNDTLRRLAKQLAQRGIATLRYDKRGVAASRPATPNERNLSVEQYVADAQGWIKLLKSDSRFNQVFVIGHSEGALIASLSADNLPVAGVISVSGSSRPIDQVLREQLSYRLPPALLTKSTRILDSLLAGQPTLDVPQELEVLFRPTVQPYLISLFQQDPAKAFSRVHAPALIVQGDHDIQVDVSDAERLKQARPDAQLVVIKGMNHVLRIVPLDIKAQLASYDNPKLPLSRELIDTISQFIVSTAD